MIEFEKLSELKNASKFGTCNQCGVDTNEDKTLVRIKFEQVSVTLCEQHLYELHDKLVDYINWKMQD